MGNDAKDTLQVITESAADHVGKIATIITGALHDIAKELGDWLGDVMEIREAAQHDREDQEP